MPVNNFEPYGDGLYTVTSRKELDLSSDLEDQIFSCDGKQRMYTIQVQVDGIVTYMIYSSCNNLSEGKDDSAHWFPVESANLTDDIQKNIIGSFGMIRIEVLAGTGSLLAIVNGK